MTSHQMVSLCVVVYFLMTISFASSSAQELRARVVDGTAEAGRLEIFYNETWNTVCDDDFGQKEALVACRMLGFNSTTAAAVMSSKYGQGSGPILFDELQCVGNETSLAQCKHWGFYRHNCEHSEDVGVACSIAQKLRARVVNGTAEAGRLEIFYDGEWNTVCDDSFGEEEALVACRMLGFNSTTAVVVGSAKYGAGSGPILFSHLRCLGHETSLTQCKYPGLYRHNCEHWEDVGVACNMTKQTTAQSTSLFWIGLVIVPILILIGAFVFLVIRRRAAQIKTSDDKEMPSTGSRGGNAQNETANGNEGERTSKKSDSSTSSPGQAAGNGSKSGGSTPRSSSSGSDKPSTNPNYTSTALQEVEIHPYMDLHTRDPTYASTTSSKDPHMYMELKTLKALQPGSEKNGNDGYETPQVPGQANKSSDGYETPQPPREGRRRSATYANQGVPADPIQEEVNYYNEA